MFTVTLGVCAIDGTPLEIPAVTHEGVVMLFETKDEAIRFAKAWGKTFDGFKQSRVYCYIGLDTEPLTEHACTLL